MCGQCSLVQMGVSREAFLAVTTNLNCLPSNLANDIFDAVTAPDQGDHLGEATFFATLAVAIDRFLSGARSHNHSFNLGFLMPITAHDTRLDANGVPSARYETGEMTVLLESFRRIWMSETVRTSLDQALRTHGLAMPTFACSGIAVVPFADRNTTLDWYRTSGWQRRRALVDQGDRTFGPEQFATINNLPKTIDLSATQLGAIAAAHRMAKSMVAMDAASTTQVVAA